MPGSASSASRSGLGRAVAGSASPATNAPAMHGHIPRRAPAGRGIDETLKARADDCHGDQADDADEGAGERGPNGRGARAGALSAKRTPVPGAGRRRASGAVDESRHAQRVRVLTQPRGNQSSRCESPR